MHGFFNIVLRINATQKSFDLKVISDELTAGVLGGKGLAARLLPAHNPPGVDPLSPENHLIIACGPVTGTEIPGSCRHGIYFKSPRTGYYAESYSGGKIAEYIAKTGFDAVMIHGTSDESIWIEVCEDTAFFHSASDLCGLDTYTTENRVRDWITEHREAAKNAGVLVMGPEAENGEHLLMLENDYPEPGERAGVGTVIGSKKIKAIAFWGNRKKDLADPAKVKEFSSELAKKAGDNMGIKAYKNPRPTMMVDINPDQIERKAEMLVEWEDRGAIFDSLVLCRSYRDLYQWDDLTEMIKLVTGLELDKAGMRAIAGKITDDVRRFNLREGLDPAEDRLPKRFCREALPETGRLISEEYMQRLLKDCYRLRGWDEQGRPPAIG